LEHAEHGVIACTFKLWSEHASYDVVTTRQWNAHCQGSNTDLALPKLTRVNISTQEIFSSVPQSSQTFLVDIVDKKDILEHGT
jgi:hypothetical protein